MLAVLLSLFALLMPASPAAAPETGRQLAWLDGTWRTEALEMRCAASGAGTACHEEGRNDAMKGAVADLTFSGAGEGAKLTVALPSIPASTFMQVARDARSATFETRTNAGVARLRFTRSGDTLKVERGNAAGWATAMSYRRA